MQADVKHDTKLLYRIQSHAWQMAYKAKKAELTDDDLYDIAISCEVLLDDLRKVGIYER